ncbi:hypothetical protein SteCoe_26720 [Stentor coeruleus]|uniref:Uncharacterized protein n=1 Tax=Stentor coeruleus TaxID=5963 RepID=A0A1R2BCK4_9CILI|nr:hypothetical protein SteCoe_26720 [Stentor coeruleus]
MLIALTFANSSLEILKTGESCDKSPSFNITSFVVNPFPPGNSEQYIVTFSGIFLSKETVHQIYIGQRKGTENWHYVYQTVDKTYAKGATETYYISLQAPAIKGPYTDQITLHRSDFSSFACWQYNYVI